jgi:hypothetical protein
LRRAFLKASFPRSDSALPQLSGNPGARGTDSVCILREPACHVRMPATNAVSVVFNATFTVIASFIFLSQGSVESCPTLICTS